MNGNNDGVPRQRQWRNRARPGSHSKPDAHCRPEVAAKHRLPARHQDPNEREVSASMVDNTNLPIFHLSFPVLDLAAAKAFYRDRLGAKVGRDNGQWADVILFGHQVTLHERPGEVARPEHRGVRHFGVILPWLEWEALGIRLQRQGCAFLQPPVVSREGTDREQGKMLLCDPSDNLIEIKAYRNAGVVLGPDDDGS